MLTFHTICFITRKFSLIRAHLLASAFANSPQAAQTGFADAIRALHQDENIATVIKTDV